MGDRKHFRQKGCSAEPSKWRYLSSDPEQIKKIGAHKAGVLTPQRKSHKEVGHMKPIAAGPLSLKRGGILPYRLPDPKSLGQCHKTPRTFGGSFWKQWR